MFGFCESPSPRELTLRDLVVLIVRRVMGLFLLVILIGLVAATARFLSPLLAVVVAPAFIVAIVWVIHHEKNYAAQMVGWWYRRFVNN